MLFLIVFLFSFELIICSDVITISNPVEYTREIMFKDTESSYLIGYMDSENPLLWKPFNKKLNPVRISEFIKPIQVLEHSNFLVKRFEAFSTTKCIPPSC